MDDLRETGFACAPGLRIEAHERLVALQFAQVAATLERIEAVMERLERRLWIAVYGVVAAIGAQAAQQIVGM
ncbi:GTA head formation protein, RCAP_rcc01685 family [Limimaricola variabilis]|jgi:hypothetical protein|uniref:GTA head formation protein, RCAP_rcc01685 family n=1 Tax=Limimaricola variabilis TaxID=1492771 RepID=UPI002AC935E1|nr:hypothetical protein [Limimaricola variabilis]WPY95070.1 hypothetical protein T8T21_02795 [Limimaricola variabilis]